MKILFLAHRTPYPPNKGDKIRSYHILSCLAEAHVVSLACWVDDPKDLEYTPALERICKGSVMPIVLDSLAAKLRGIASLSSGRSFSEGYFFSRKFQHKVNQLFERGQFDLFYVFSSPMAQYVKPFCHIPTIMDFVDVDSDKWGQLARFKRFPLSRIFLLEKERLARYEIAISRWARWSLFVSEAEANLFRAMGGDRNTVVLPNGVDSDLLRLPIREGESGSVRRESTIQGTKIAKIVFAGSMNYFPNADAASYFVHEIFPLIRRGYSKVTFDIVGRFPPRAVRKLNQVEGVRVLGEVEDIRPHLLRADVSVAPIRIARGVQNKVLEAMAVGIPVVATSLAAEGIQVRAGEEILVGDTPETFANQVVRLLQDRKLHSDVAKKARDRVVQSYRWKGVSTQLENLIAETLPTAPPKIAEL